MRVGPLVVVETHPIQYHAPVYRILQQSLAIPVTAIYGSDFSVMGYRDPEFGTAFAWDCDLLSGYTSLFLSRVRAAGARTAAEVSAHGLGKLLQDVAPSAILLVGYSPRFHQVACYHSWRSGRPMIFRARLRTMTEIALQSKHGQEAARWVGFTSRAPVYSTSGSARTSISNVLATGKTDLFSLRTA